MRIKSRQQPPSQAIILREDLVAEKGSVLLINPDESVKVCTRQEFDVLYEQKLRPERPKQRKERLRRTAKAWHTGQGRAAFAYIGDGRDRKSVSALIVMVLVALDKTGGEALTSALQPHLPFLADLDTATLNNRVAAALSRAKERGLVTASASSERNMKLWALTSEGRALRDREGERAAKVFEASV